jgi:hypothetical protein
MSKTKSEVRSLDEFVTSDDVMIAAGERLPDDHAIVGAHSDMFVPAKPLPDGYDLVIAINGFATNKHTVVRGSQWHDDDPVVARFPGMFAPGYLTEREQASVLIARRYNSPTERAARKETRAAEAEAAERRRLNELAHADELERQAAEIRGQVGQ